MTQKQFKHLFTPLEIGSTVLKNRLGFAPNCPVTGGKQAEGTFDEDSVSYYGERAKGGQGLIIIGNTRVSKSTTYYPYLDPQLFDDSNIQPLHKIATKVQSYGAKLFIQLFHTSIGRSMEFQQNALYRDPDVSTVFAAPTAYSSFGIPGVNVKEVDLEEIQQITQDYSQAAIRAALAKVDGVEVAASHSMLPWQFLSPYFNKRNDQYGGNIENRCRFLVNILKMIRKEAGTEIVLGYRINSDGLCSGDLTTKDVQEIVQYINSNVQVDYVNVTIGNHFSEYRIQPMGYGEAGFQLPYTKQIKDISSIPVFGIGSINHPSQAEQALEKEQCDLILMARQLFADPEFANKAMANKADDIRPCVRANFCIGRGIRSLRVSCFQNPSHGRESYWGSDSLQQTPSPQGIIVIGGGPSGLEVARVAAEKGHHVVLYEQHSNLGGRLRLQAQLPFQYEWGKTIAWYEHTFKSLSVQALLNQTITTDNLPSILNQQGPDKVVIATGSKTSATSPVLLFGSPIDVDHTLPVYTYESILNGEYQNVDHITIIDDFSDEIAPGLALLLAQSITNVEIITQWSTIASSPYTIGNHIAHLERIHSASNITITPDTFIKSINKQSVTLFNVYSGIQWETTTQAVVLLTSHQSINDLYPVAKSIINDTYIIGDAVAPRPVHDAILEGHKLGRQL